MMDRRDFIKGTAVGSAALAVGREARGGGARPNVLIITVDQMRAPMWTPAGTMPNVDRLAASGVTFNNSFVAAAPCSPSRACLFTGTHTTQNRMFSNIDLMSTLAALCGISGLPYTVGRDFSACLTDPSAPHRDHVIFHNDWEIVYTVGNKTDAMYQNPAHIRCIRTHEWKYAYYFSPKGDKVEHELYNLGDDPLEMINLAADPAFSSIKNELSDQLFEEETGFEKDWEAERPG